MAKQNLTDFTPQRQNANKHTQRGIGLLENAMRTSGYVAPITVTADGEVIDGSARLEVAAEIFDGVEPIVVDHDGTRPVIMRRTDIPDASDPRAKRIALEANRIGQVDLDWDGDVIAELIADDPNMLAGLWTEDELDDDLKASGFYGDGKSLSDLEEEYGEPDDSMFWPEVRIKVPIETFERFNQIMTRMPGADDAARFAAVVDAAVSFADLPSEA